MTRGSGWISDAGSRHTSFDEIGTIMSTFEEILEKDGKLVYKTKGVSMNPKLYRNRDLVVIEVPKWRTKVVLRRIIKGKK